MKKKKYPTPIKYKAPPPPWISNGPPLTRHINVIGVGPIKKHNALKNHVIV